MNKTITTILLVILAIVGGYFIFQQYQQAQQIPSNNTNNENIVNKNGELWGENNNQQNSENTTTSTVEAPKNWNQYSTSTYRFYYPPKANVQSEADITKVQMTGPKNTTGTEIKDGFTFYVTDVNGFDWKKFRESIKQLNPKDVMIENSPAIKYTTTTEMGSISTRVVMETEETTSTVFVVSYSINDPNDVGYEDMINTMMKTLELKNTSNNENQRF